MLALACWQCARSSHFALVFPSTRPYVRFQKSFIRDIFVSQRVSQGWRDVINDSKLIKRKLFLEPTLEEPAVFPDSGHIRVNCNDFLGLENKSFVTFDEKTCFNTYHRVPNESANPIWRHLQKNIVMDHDTEIADFKWYEFTDWSKKSAAENAKAYKVYQYNSLGTDDYYQTFSPPERDFSQAWQRKDASWRKMLLMQPPVLANMEAVFGIAR